MGVGGNSALSKNSTDGILNLLQLSLLGSNAGVNVNAAATSSSSITNMNTSIVPNTNNMMAAKTNFYSQSVGANLTGIGIGNIAGGIMTPQPIISQSVCVPYLSIGFGKPQKYLLEHLFKQLPLINSSVVFLNVYIQQFYLTVLIIIKFLMMFTFFFYLKQLNQAQPIIKTGRPIVNTANLAANTVQQHQVNSVICW